MKIAVVTVIENGEITSCNAFIGTPQGICISGYRGQGRHIDDLAMEEFAVKCKEINPWFNSDYSDAEEDLEALIEASHYEYNGSEVFITHPKLP
jgi:hypothetical protein